MPLIASPLRNDTIDLPWPIHLDFVEDFPQIVPDSPLAHVQFSVKWKCVNTGDEDSPEAGVRVDLIGADGGLLLLDRAERRVTAAGRNGRGHCGRRRGGQRQPNRDDQWRVSGNFDYRELRTVKPLTVNSGY